MCAKIRLSNLSLRREFKTFRQFSFADFKMLDSLFSKSDSEKFQHEVLPDNCQLKTFQICCVKLLLRILAPFPFKWNRLVLRWLVLIFFLGSMRKYYFCYTLLWNDGWLSFSLLFNSGLSALIITNIRFFRF